MTTSHEVVRFEVKVGLELKHCLSTLVIVELKFVVALPRAGLKAFRQRRRA